MVYYGSRFLLQRHRTDMHRSDRRTARLDEEMACRSNPSSNGRSRQIFHRVQSMPLETTGFLSWKRRHQLGTVLRIDAMARLESSINASEARTR